jgi:uridine kinase
VTEPAAPWLLAVDGIDGSGKSVLAEAVVTALENAGTRAVLLRVDDYRRPVNWKAEGRAEADVYYDDYYDLAQLDEGVRAFLDGAPGISIPVFDSSRERLDGQRWIAFEGASALVVEGVFAQRAHTVRERGQSVYLRTSFDEARRRILARDTARGRTVADVSHRIDARYFPAQERYLREHDPVARAAVLVEHERLAAPVLARLDSARIAPTLQQTIESALAAFAAPRAVR